MPAGPRARIPPAPRKTLLQWIDIDDGDTASTTKPACSAEVQAIHARILVSSADGRRGDPEPIQPPAGLALAPLG